MIGTVFNIQKFSIHDGPGIRTTVFLKGCPLRCTWCANPESQLEKIQILYDQKKCQHCLSCIKACPIENCIKHENNRIIVDFKKCIGCLKCINACNYQALSNEGELKEVDQVVEACLQDIDFYEESGGGVTISGGEGMSQPYFVSNLVDRLKEYNIHCAIETTAYVKPEIFQNLATKFDLLLFDVKHYDSKKHQKGTGVPNELIINNLKWAVKNNITILPRIPVIPGFNSELEDAKGLADLLNTIGIKQVQLLPFHQFGEKKYELLNRKYLHKDTKALHKEDLLEYQQEFIKKNINAFF